MLKIKNYVKAESLEEAYTLNQKRTSVVLGGMVWLKMGNRNVPTAIDLSGLGLDGVTETDEEFVIGAMTPLRDLETHAGLNAYTCGAMRESLRHIVGVQFRNCATIGGSIWGRFGFSDVLTMFLALDTDVELYRGGIVPLAEFAAMQRDRDILVRLHVKKTPLRTVYVSQRNSKTDFPVLACAISVKDDGKVCSVYGARPGRALQFWDESGILDGFLQLQEEEQKATIGRYAKLMQKTVPTEGNMRASAEYRSHLVRVLTARALTKVAELPDPSSFKSENTGAAGVRQEGGRYEA